jgi:predicted  nucleic acid-binding Zn-ribbon protein
LLFLKTVRETRMPAVTEALRNLQQTETRLRTTRDMLNRKKRALRVHEKRIATLSEQIQVKRQEARSLTAGSANQETELRSRQEQIGRKRAQLNAVKTNKEYAAILAEIRNEEADNSRHEEAILQALSKIDACNNAIKEIEGQLAKERQLMGELQARLADELGALEGRIRELEGERRNAADSVEPDVLNLFERIADHHDGEALANVVCVDEREGNWICGGCNMGIPVDTINQLQTSDSVLRCANCSRILYFEE